MYTRFKQIHGIKMRTVLTPDGICTCFGATSARRHDTGLTTGNGLLAMSGLNEFLIAIQQDRPATTTPYASMGGSIYGVNLECIHSYFNAHFTPAMMTEFMRI